MMKEVFLHGTSRLHYDGVSPTQGQRKAKAKEKWPGQVGFTWSRKCRLTIRLDSKQHKRQPGSKCSKKKTREH